MDVLNTVVGFAAAWLACGLGLFIATGSLRALRPQPAPATAGRVEARVARSWKPTQLLYALPLVVALGLLATGVIGVILVVPW